MRTFYFQEQFDTRPFVDLDVSLMPRLLELVTMTTAQSQDLDAVFHMLRNCNCLPELFSHPSPEANARQLELKVNQLEAVIAPLRLEIDELNVP